MPVTQPRRNRVTPFGTIESTPHRGLLMGNRGDLHAPEGSLGRLWKSKRWISCILDGNGWKAPMDEPGRNYPLFFYDEAVALAAGHRPCGECRSEALGAFVTAWKKARGISRCESISLKEIDQDLHHARTRELRSRSSARVSELPDGAYVWHPDFDHRAMLVFNNSLIPWEHHGLGNPYFARHDERVQMLTPTPIVDVLRAGYVSIMFSILQPVAKYDQA